MSGGVAHVLRIRPVCLKPPEALSCHPDGPLGIWCGGSARPERSRRVSRAERGGSTPYLLLVPSVPSIPTASRMICPTPVPSSSSMLLIFTCLILFPVPSINPSGF